MNDGFKAKNGFTQVARVTASNEELSIDPLSLFLSEDRVEGTCQSNQTFEEPILAEVVGVTRISHASPLLNETPLLSPIIKAFPNQIPKNKIPPSPSLPSVPHVIATPVAVENQVPDTSDPINQDIMDRINEIPDFPFLGGETLSCHRNDGFIGLKDKFFPGTLFVTNYRISFIMSPVQLMGFAASNPSIYSWVNIPLGCIEKIDKDRRLNPRDHGATIYTITIVCKDVRIVKFCFEIHSTSSQEYEIEKLLNVIQGSAFPNMIRRAFAFGHAFPHNYPLIPGYDITREFHRMGILQRSTQWRFSEANAQYGLCSSYPKIVVVPNDVTDDELFIVRNFRSIERIPVMCWGNKDNGATIWRSSQPKAGISGLSARCPYDEAYLNRIALSCAIKTNPLGGQYRVNGTVLHIVDCRPKKNAMTNAAAGAGFEYQNNYPNTRIDFYNIENIHAMRESLKGVVALVMNTHTKSDVNFGRYIEDTHWLTHVRLVLRTSLCIARFINAGDPVLVHCSHGWDRTAQVCAISQLFLDSYYRTMDGFKVLVEKEFCSFGHQFHLRCSHLCDRRQEDQISPIFFQFLDSVWQLVNQFPHFFEFNSRYLLTIADHLYSCRFGTFLFNTPKERDSVRADLLPDLWSFLHYNRRNFLNPFYLDPSSEDTPTTHIFIPIESQMLRNVTLWTDYFFRWSTAPSILCPPESSYRMLIKNGMMSLQGGRDSDTMTTNEEFQTIPTDLQLFPLVCSSDRWEALYRGALVFDKDKSNSNSHDLDNESQPVIRSSSVSLEDHYSKAESIANLELLSQKNYIIECQQEVIDRMSALLRQHGCSEESISEAITSPNLMSSLTGAEIIGSTSMSSLASSSAATSSATSASSSSHGLPSKLSLKSWTDEISAQENENNDESNDYYDNDGDKSPSPVEEEYL